MAAKPQKLEIPQPPDHKLTLVRIPSTGSLYLYQYQRAPPDGWELVSAVKVRPEDTAALVGFIARTAPNQPDPYEEVQWGWIAS